MCSPEATLLRPTHFRYRLSAVVIHAGVGLSQGHYYSYGVTRRADGGRDGGVDDDWYLYNDSFVARSSFDALNAADSATAPGHAQSTPYIFMYERAGDS